MDKRLKYFVIIPLFAVNIFLTLFGFISLYYSPFTGIFMGECSGKPCIERVEEGSPAELAGIRPGDRIVDVNGIEIPDFAFAFDPDLLRSGKEIPLFWEAQKRLDEAIAIGRTVDILAERGAERLELTLTPIAFPLARIVGRLYLMFLINWVTILIPYLILRKRVYEVTVVFFLWVTFSAMNSLSCAFQVRDISFPYLPFRFLSEVNHASVIISAALFIHLAIIFPRKRAILDKAPWLLKGVYVTSATLLLFLLLTPWTSTWSIQLGI